MRLKKICVVTGTRADYGLLHWLMRDIGEDQELHLQVIATGMHLSKEFGRTYLEIENDGFQIDEKIDISLTSDSNLEVSKSIGIGIMKFAEVFEKIKPDMLVVLGDRFEILSTVSAAMIAKIPIAHIHGGETTEGVIDEAIRHSITKMSHLHFTATDEYRKRVVQLGENPKRVFNVGGLGVDNISKLNLLTKKQLEREIGFALGDKTILVTFHPVTLEKKSSEFQFNELLASLDDLFDTRIIFTKSNSDPDGRIINQMIDEFTKNRKNTIAYSSMGYLNYLSTMQFVDFIIGNSSSGLLEAPSFKIATINIGDRQKGRIKAKSVIDCPPLRSQISEAIRSACSEEFKSSLGKVKNPYGTGGASRKILKIIKSTNFKQILKKTFFDIKIDM